MAVAVLSPDLKYVHVYKQLLNAFLQIGRKNGIKYDIKYKNW